MTWKAAEFLCANLSESPLRVRGRVSFGLGMSLIERARGRDPSVWSVIHLNTGHVIGYLPGKREVAFAAGTEVVECADWSFIGLNGWRNQDPGLLERVRAVFDRHGGTLLEGGVKAPEHARQIAERVGA